VDFIAILGLIGRHGNSARPLKDRMTASRLWLASSSFSTKPRRGPDSEDSRVFTRFPSLCSCNIELLAPRKQKICVCLTYSHIKEKLSLCFL